MPFLCCCFFWRDFYTPYDPDAMNGAAKFAPTRYRAPVWVRPLRKGYIKPGDEQEQLFFVAVSTVVLGGGIGILVELLLGISAAG